MNQHDDGMMMTAMMYPACVLYMRGTPHHFQSIHNVTLKGTTIPALHAMQNKQSSITEDSTYT